MVDRISELPDDILVSIISLLTLREANKTTKTLSTRWRRLDHTGKAVSVKFPFPTQRREGYNNGYVQTGDETKFSDYLNCINRGGILDSYKGGAGGGAIKILRIDIPCFEAAETEIRCSSKMLVEFASSMETEAIDIRMVYSSANQQPLRPLPYLRFCNITLINHGGLKCLKELSLSGVGLHYEDIGTLLLHAASLERLAIESPQIISDEYEDYIGVLGNPACKLKHLLISNVWESQYTIKVHDVMSLVSLKCDGLGVFNLDLQNLPKLAHLRARTAKRGALVGRFPHISCFDCVQLQRLELSVGLFNDEVKKARLTMINDMYVRKHPCVKHLELNVFIGKECSVHQLFPFIQAFPYLEKLEIKFIRSFEPGYDRQRKLDKDHVNKTMTRISHLNTVRLLGFSGRIFELEFALCVLHNVEELQELTIEGCVTNCAIQQKQIARSFQYLLSVTPSFVDLILK